MDVQIGTGVETSIGDVVKRTGEILGKPLTVDTEDKRIRPAASEVDRLVCDPGDAARHLNWHPAVSFENGLRYLIAWMKARARANVNEYVI
jgi:nucleoside-diphosphate-sugar epimerase